MAKDILGCSCPDEVFNKIESHPLEKYRGLKINIGDRLLIYLIDADSQTPLLEQLPLIIEQGITERNEYGFNRFRLVIHSLYPEEIQELLFEVFNQTKFKDDKTHLHVLALPDELL